jgi:hypothetical protein
MGPCAFVDPEGRLVPEELDRLDRIIEAYEAQVVRACRRVPGCTDDGGAFARQVDRREDISPDLAHLTVRGQARAAAVAWAAMRRRGVLPP